MQRFFLFKNNRRVFSGEILKRLKQYAWDKEVVPGITSVETAGHTTGHTSFVVASESDRMFVFSDVTNRPELFVRNPRALLLADKLLVQTFHAPFPGHGYIEKDGQGYRFIPAAWNPVL